MKTLDVQALHHAIDQTLEQLKKQSDELPMSKKVWMESRPLTML